jgi:2-methylcitrate dehydratase PrpD
MDTREITAQVATFIEKTRISEMPGPVVQKAKQLVTDLLGVATAGSREKPARIIQGFIEEQNARGSATIIGTDQRSHPAASSLANGISGHVLDYDDVSEPMYGHPTVAVLPACLALGEELDVSGKDLLESYIIGLEVTVKLSYGMNPAHYEHGWHSTCTLGSMGAAAAAAKLLGLTGEQLRTALALAASQAGGLQQNFGTMIKSFHSGRAAENGVLAALLAQRGWTGDQNILEAPLGFFHLFCGPGHYDAERCVNSLGKPFEIDRPGIILKKYPSCAFSHPAIDAALIIAQDPQYDVSKLERVEGHIHSLADQILIHRNPQTGLEAKFSLEACVTLALLDGRVNTKSFADRRLANKDFKETLKRVQRVVAAGDKKGPRGFGPAEVRVLLRGEEIKQARVEKAKGNPENPMTEEEIREKYLDCCSGVLSQESIEKSLSLLQNLDVLDGIRPLMDCFQIAPTPS